MIKRYKITEKSELLYKEAWYNEQQSAVIVHFGKVGFIGKNEEFKVDNLIKANDFFEQFEAKCQEEGFHEIGENDYYWVVVQYSLKSEFGNKRDHWLKDKVQEYLKSHLGWRGLGDVDGFDIGNKKLNIFCLVVDADKAVSSIKTCLKDYHLDLTQARIATRKFEEEEYQLKYSHKKEEKFELM